MSVTSTEIKQALEKRHCFDFFMTEVKNGPTQTGMLQVDAVAIPKSWAHQEMIGYEIKVSRSDFQRDPKIHLYLKYFHHFYIVCPSGMIDKKEISDDVGLIWYNQETKCFTTKKKAAWRNVEIDPDMMWYILMYRLQSDRYPFHNSRQDFIEDYIKNESSERDLGRQLGSKMSQRVSHLAVEVERLGRNGDYQKTLKELEEIFEKHGIRTWGDLAKNLEEALSRGYPKEIDVLISQLEAAKKTAEKMTTVNELREAEE